MEKVKYGSFLFPFLGVILILNGCTRSLEVSFRSDMNRLNESETLKNLKIGVCKFEDKRAWVDRSNTQSESYIALQGAWKFGMTFMGKEYTPVNEFIQNIFLDEFSKAGLNAQPIKEILEKGNKKAFRISGEQQGTDYVLGGQILSFEFVNETGVWTVTSRRTVMLSLMLIKVKNEEILLDTVFNETDREGEGAGIRHSTNVDKLMNRAFKKVVQQVIQRVAEKMALNVRDVSFRILVLPQSSGNSGDTSPDMSASRQEKKEVPLHR